MWLQLTGLVHVLTNIDNNRVPPKLIVTGDNEHPGREIPLGEGVGGDPGGKELLCGFVGCEWPRGPMGRCPLFKSFQRGDKTRNYVEILEFYGWLIIFDLFLAIFRKEITTILTLWALGVWRSLIKIPQC